MVLDDLCIYYDILIFNDLCAGVCMGNVVVIEIIDCGMCNCGMMGKVVEVLGENMVLGMEM